MGCHAETETSYPRLKLFLTAFCGLNIACYFIGHFNYSVILALASGAYFALSAAWNSIKEKVLDVNFLMITAALGAIYVGNPIDAAILLFLFSLSSALESLTMAKTQSAIESLMKLRPDKAIKVVKEKDLSVEIGTLKPGDLVRVLPYQQIPTDGVLETDYAEANESFMTGEAKPVSKKKGDPLLAGTQNLDQMLLMNVTHALHESTLEKILQLIKEAQHKKASGEKISQWFGQRYTLFVIFVFILSLSIRMINHYSYHEALATSITLLVGLSPCAIVISSPAATLSALAWCARRGILVRGGEFIETAGKITRVVFDKTGTLTQGKFQLSELLNWENREEKRWKQGDQLSPEFITILQKAASLEQYSTHPLAVAIVETSKRHSIILEENKEVKILPGLGIQAKQEEFYLGQPKLFEGLNILIPLYVQEKINLIQAQGNTVIVMNQKDSWSLLSLSDTIRESAQTLIQGLKQQKIEQMVMLTGDNYQAAKQVADQLKIKTFEAQLLPEDKERIVGNYIQEGKLMMVGDGVNDAPSLARSDIGIAMGGLGSDIALKSADVVLVQDSLEKIVDLIAIGKSTNKIIVFNLSFAIGMILLLTFYSFFSYLPLPLAVLGHEGSTLIVILNSLRLLKHPSYKLKSN